MNTTNMFLRNFFFLKCLLITLVCVLHKVNSIKCYSCNSKRDKLCLDPFFSNFTAANVNSNIVDCSNEVSTRQFISHFSNLMSALGISMNFNSKYALSKMSEQSQYSACQKVEIIDNNEHIVIRDCSILSDIVCDSLKNGSRTDSSIRFCEICDSDYCNSSRKVFTSWNLLSIIMLTYRAIV